MWDLHDGAVSEALERQEKREILNLEAISHVRRRNSDIFRIKVRFADGEGGYLVKLPRRDAELQYAAQLRAEAIFEADLSFLPTCPVFLPDSGIIVSRLLTGHDLEKELLLRDLRSVWGWRARAVARVRATGDWLKRFHADSMEPECPVTLSPYIEQRAPLFAALPADLQARLRRMAEAPMRGGSTVIHGDFCPHNIMFTGQRISILDYGINEWTRFTPYWDLTCFVTSLERMTVTSKRSPLYWLSGVFRRVLDEFWQAYGEDPSDHPDFIRCRALRHMNYVITAQSGGSATLRGWHAVELERYLARWEALA